LSVLTIKKLKNKPTKTPLARTRPTSQKLSIMSFTRSLNVDDIEGIANDNKLRVRFQAAYDPSRRGQPDQFALDINAQPIVIVQEQPPHDLLTVTQDGEKLSKDLTVEAIAWTREITASWSAPLQPVTGWYTLEAWQDGTWRYVDRVLKENPKDQMDLDLVPIYSVLGRPRDVRVYARPKLDPNVPGQFSGTQAFSARVYVEGRGPWDTKEMNYFRSEMERVDVMFSVADPKQVEYLNLFRAIVARVEPSFQHVALLALLELSGRDIFPAMSRTIVKEGDLLNRMKGVLKGMKDEVVISIDTLKYFEDRVEAKQRDYQQARRDRAQLVANQQKIEDLNDRIAKLTEDRANYSADGQAQIDKEIQEARDTITELTNENKQLGDPQVDGSIEQDQERLERVRLIDQYVKEVYKQALIDYEHFVARNTLFPDRGARFTNAQDMLKNMRDELAKIPSFVPADERDEVKNLTEVADVESASFVKVVDPPEPEKVPSIFAKFMSDGRWPSDISDRLAKKRDGDSPWLRLETLSDLEGVLKQLFSRDNKDDIDQYLPQLRQVSVQVREAIATITNSGSFLLIPRMGRESVITVPSSFVTPRTRVEFHDGSSDRPQVCYLSLCSNTGGLSESPRDQLNRLARKANPYFLEPSRAKWFFAELPEEMRTRQIAQADLEKQVNHTLNIKALPFAFAKRKVEKQDDSDTEEETDEEDDETDDEENDESGAASSSSSSGNGDIDDLVDVMGDLTIRNRIRSVGEKMRVRTAFKRDDERLQLSGSVLPRHRENVGLYIGLFRQDEQEGYAGPSDIGLERLPILGVRYYTWEEGPIDLGAYRMGDLVTMDGSPFIEEGEMPLWSPMNGPVLHYDRPPYLRELYRLVDRYGIYGEGQSVLGVRMVNRSDPSSWLLRSDKSEHTLLFRWQVQDPEEDEITQPIQWVVKQFSSFHDFDSTDEGVKDFHYEMPHRYEYALSLDRLCNYYGNDNRVNFSLVTEDLRCWPGVGDRWAPPYLRYTPDPRLLPDVERQFVLFNPLSGTWVVYTTPSKGRPLLQAVRDLNQYASEHPSHGSLVKVRAYEQSRNPPDLPNVTDETGFPGGQEALRQYAVYDVQAPEPLLPKVLGATLNESFVLWVNDCPELQETLDHSPHYTSLRSVPIELLLHWVLDWVARYQQADEIKYAQRLEEFRSVWAQMTSRLNHFMGLAARTPEHALSLKPSHIHATHRAAWKPYLSRLPPADRDLLSSPITLEDSREFDPRVWRYTATIREIEESREFLLPLGTFARGEESPGDFSAKETDARAARKLFEIRLRRYANTEEDRAFRERIADAYARTIPTRLIDEEIPRGGALPGVSTIDWTQAEKRFEELQGLMANPNADAQVAAYVAVRSMQAVSPFALTPSLKGVLAPVEKESMPASFGMARADITIAKWLQGLADEDDDVEEEAPSLLASAGVAVAFTFDDPMDFARMVMESTLLPSFATFMDRYVTPYRAELEKRVLEEDDGGQEQADLLAQAIAAAEAFSQRSVDDVFGTPINTNATRGQLNRIALNKIQEEHGDTVAEVGQAFTDAKEAFENGVGTWSDAAALLSNQVMFAPINGLVEDAVRAQRAQLRPVFEEALQLAQESVKADAEATFVNQLGKVPRDELGKGPLYDLVMRKIVDPKNAAMTTLSAKAEQILERAKARKDAASLLSAEGWNDLLGSARGAYEVAGGVLSKDLITDDLLGRYTAEQLADTAVLADLAIREVEERRQQVIVDMIPRAQDWEEFFAKERAQKAEEEARRRAKEAEEAERKQREAEARRRDEEAETERRRQEEEARRRDEEAEEAEAKRRRQAAFDEKRPEAFSRNGQNDVTILVVGDPGVGKTSLIDRFVNEVLVGIPGNTESVTSMEVPVVLENGQTFNVTLKEVPADQMADIKTLETPYTGVAMVFDVNTAKSFENCDVYNGEIVEKMTNAKRALLGNKVDVEGKRVVSTKRAQAWARKKDALYFETSAKEGITVEEAFRALIGQVTGIGVERVERVELSAADLSINAKVVSELYDGGRQTLGDLLGVVSGAAASSTSSRIEARYNTREPMESVWINSSTRHFEFRETSKNILDALYGQTLIYPNNDNDASASNIMSMQLIVDGQTENLCESCLYIYVQGDTPGILNPPRVKFTELLAAGLEVANTVCVTIGQLDPEVWKEQSDNVKRDLSFKGSSEQFKLVLLGVDTEAILHLLVIPGLSKFVDALEQDHRPYYNISGDWRTTNDRLAGRAKRCPPLLNPYKHAKDEIKASLSLGGISKDIVLTPRVLTEIMNDTANDKSGKVFLYKVYNPSMIVHIRDLRVTTYAAYVRPFEKDIRAVDGEFLFVHYSNTETDIGFGKYSLITNYAKDILEDNNYSTITYTDADGFDPSQILLYFERSLWQINWTTVGMTTRDDDLHIASKIASSSQ